LKYSSINHRFQVKCNIHQLK